MSMQTLKKDPELFPSGQHAFFLTGPAGVIEVNTTADEGFRQDRVGIVCHPHPLHQGTMNNKVVTTAAKAMQKNNFPVIRFNYRGVGKSAGTYGETIGESEDLLAVLLWVKRVLPHAQIVLAGFSFGAYIALKVACEQMPLSLLAIAPAVPHQIEYIELAKKIVCPYWVIVGEKDEVVPAEAVQAWHQYIQSPTRLIIMLNASHFFHGQLMELQRHIHEWIQQTAL